MDTSSAKYSYGMIFGRMIKAELSRQGVTNLRLAEHCDVTPTAVSTWLNGTLPGLDNVLQIVDFLDISLDRAFGRTPGAVAALKQVHHETAAVLGAIETVLPDESVVDDVQRQMKKKAAKKATKKTKKKA